MSYLLGAALLPLPNMDLLLDTVNASRPRQDLARGNDQLWCFDLNLNLPCH